MKHLKMISLAALAAMVLTAFVGAGSASATTLEVKGVTQNQSVTIEMSLPAGTSMLWQTTSGGGEVTCARSTMAGKTTGPYTGATVTAPLTSLTFSNCTHSVTVHKPGTLHISHIAGTTNGTVTISGTEVTVYHTPIGAYVNFKTGTGTHIGTISGTACCHGSLPVNAVMNGGFFLPSAKWVGGYTVTSPTGLGVSP
jgi:hypothetical protein